MTTASPASTLTDNGRVYTARHSAAARNAFEYLLAAPEHPAEERRPEPPPDPGQDRTLPPDPETLAHRPTPRHHHHRAPSQLDASASHYNDHRPHRALDRQHPRQRLRAPPPKATPRRTPTTAATTGSATTTSTPTGRSASAAPAACTTSASAPPTAANASSPSPTTPPSPSSTSTPAKSSPPTHIDPDRSLLAQHNNKSPADGRALVHDVTYVATHDVTYVATHHTVDLRGLEPLTPCMPCRCATSCATGPDAPPRAEATRLDYYIDSDASTGDGCR